VTCSRYWIGDDVAAQAELPAAHRRATRTDRRGCTGLCHARVTGISCWAAAFEQQTGCRLIPDPTLISLYGEKVLLMHGGHALHRTDVAYLKFRAMVRNPDWVKMCSSARPSANA